MQKADIAHRQVKGQNLVLNMERTATVAVYNRTTSVTDEFIEHPAKKLVATRTQRSSSPAWRFPRKVLIMVKAGKAVDAVIDSLLPLLEPGDPIADGGNSFFEDTERRSVALGAAGFRFMGGGRQRRRGKAPVGVEHHARRLAGRLALVGDLLRAISAKAPEDGKPCVAYIGLRSAGHVKMVQRHRIWRHAVDRRSLRHPAPRGWG